MAGHSDAWAPYLAKDERVLWQGRPALGFRWRSGENATMLLGLFVIGFVGFGIYETTAAGEYDMLGGFLIWIGIGAVIGLSGPVAMAVVRRGTWYTLTDRRALIAHWPTVAGMTVYRGVDCYPITEIDLVPSDMAGLDTVQFSRLSQRHIFDDLGWRRVGHGRRSGDTRVRDQQIGFERIKDGAQVAALCRDVQRVWPDGAPITT